jgi:enoyl-[acyl-carrier protein] reductase II
MMLAHNASELAQVIVEENIKIVVTGAGSPAPYIEQWKKAGMIVISVVASVKHATKVEALGVDIIVAEGTEAGGHVGESTTMTLVPQVVDAVSVPVVAAGGIADGRGIVAALALGAQGVQLGTRFLIAEECQIHMKYKQCIIESSDTDTVVTGRSIGGPVRGIRNRMTDKFMKLEEKKASRDEMEAIALGSLRKAVVDGDVENGSLMAGQISGMVTDIKSIEEIIIDLLDEVIEITHKIGLNTLFAK